MREEDPARGGRTQHERNDDAEAHEGVASFLVTTGFVAIRKNPHETDPQVCGQSGQVRGSHDGSRDGCDHRILQTADEAQENQKRVVTGEDQGFAESSEKSELSPDGDPHKDAGDHQQNGGVVRAHSLEATSVDKECRDHGADDEDDGHEQHSEGVSEITLGETRSEQSGEACGVRDEAMAGEVSACIDGPSLKSEGPPDRPVAGRMFRERFAGQHDANSV